MTNKTFYHTPKMLLDESCSLCTSKENSFDYFIMKGKSLEIYEFYADQLVTFLFRSYGVRIEQIAIDFIKDDRDVVFFIDVNGFSVL